MTDQVNRPNEDVNTVAQLGSSEQPGCNGHGHHGFYGSSSCGPIRSGEDEHSLEQLARANEIANRTMAQQNALGYQQAIYQLTITSIAKCFEMITQMDPCEQGSREQIIKYQELIKEFNSIAKSVSPGLFGHSTNHYPSGSEGACNASGIPSNPT